ncbi:MAG: NAD-dependent epimerase/dehydratase family protein [Candidatus Eremiobacteraeota bacterium]|nr:NAD-dependent epimerase/dehydratase family protein [Candidatus Eremiobacteraeota bacterium]
MVYLVAGGAGFIGSHLVNALVDDANPVFIVDNLTTGSIRNLEHAVSSGLATFIYLDIASPHEVLSNLLARAGCNRVHRIFHLAPLPPGNTATLGLTELAAACASRLLFVAERDAQDERTLCAHIEQSRRRGVDARIVRLPECFGPGMDDLRCELVSRLCESASDVDVENIEDAHAPLTFVGDAVAALRHAMEQLIPGSRPINVETKYTLRDIAHAAACVRRGAVALPLERNLYATYRWLREERMAFA